MKALYFLVGGLIGGVLTYAVMKRKVDNVLIQYDETVEELRKLQKKAGPEHCEPDPTETKEKEEIHPIIDREILDVTKESVDKTAEEYEGLKETVNTTAKEYKKLVANYEGYGYGEQYQEGTADEFDDGDDDLERIELMAFEDGTLIETTSDLKVSIVETIGYDMLHKLQAMKWGIDDKVIYVKNTQTKCYYEVMANKDTYLAYMDSE